jgi:predicted PurR-regulated permease PerM
MNNNEFTQKIIEAVIRIGLLMLLIYWCYSIVRPFIMPVLWGVIIAVAIYPIFTKLKSLMGERNKLASIVYTLIALAFLITPAVMISDSLIETSSVVSEKYQAGTLKIPSPKESVKEWPVIGEDAYAIWSEASVNLEGTLKKYEAQTKRIGSAMISAASSAAGTVLQFVLSIIISGILLANASGAYSVTIKIFNRFINPDSGQEFADLSKVTIRSVTQGVLGVAIIQALLSGLGMLVMDVPAWGVWTLLVLLFAIAQLPPIIVLGFVSAYVFSVAETTPAVIFLIYCLIVSASDGVLKPLFLGRGMSTPMLVILLGAIGGMMMSGIIGLFVGAIVLALGYELFIKWLNRDDEVVEHSTSLKVSE